jgi:hypothetical protein
MVGALFILAITVQTGLAGEIREIELNDGSVITGELLSLSGGVYTVKSDSLGTVRIEEAKIRTVRTKTPTFSGSRSSGGASVETGSLADRMMNDTDIMNTIQELQDDPDFKKILGDPEIMQAIINNDVATLMSKPEFMKLLDKPSVRSIQEKVK